MPWLSVSEDRVEDGEELAHGGDQGGLGGPATGPEAKIEVADGRVPANGGDGGHEHHAAHVRPSARNGAVAAPCVGVAIDGRYPDQRGEAAAVDAAEFGQLGDQRAGGDPADAGREVSRSSPARQAGEPRAST